MEAQVYAAVTAKELEIDDQGRIWRLAKRGWNRWKQTTECRPCKRIRAENKTSLGYLQIRTMVDKVRAQVGAHRIVFRHFNGPIPDGMTINHKNGEKDDNRPENLELATYREQQIHALHVLKVGRTNQNGERNAMSKLNADLVAEIRRRRSLGERLASIAADFGVTDRTVSKIASGHRGSKKLSALSRSSQLWLYGDAGHPKVSQATDTVPPAGGYITEGTLAVPVLYSWAAQAKQAAIRHDSGTRAVFTFCDGHVEKWKWNDLRYNVNDVFGENSN